MSIISYVRCGADRCSRRTSRFAPFHLHASQASKSEGQEQCLRRELSGVRDRDFPRTKFQTCLITDGTYKTLQDMEWRWVQPVSTLIVGICTVGVGFFGILITAFVAYNGQQHLERMTKLSHAHDAAMRKEELRQGRLADAYVEALNEAELIGQWCSLVLPVFSDGSEPESKLPTLPDQARINALINAFGSAEVRVLRDKWIRAVRDVMEAVNDHQFLKESGEVTLYDGRTRKQVRDGLHKMAKPNERTARRELGDQMATELGHH